MKLALAALSLALLACAAAASAGETAAPLPKSSLRPALSVDDSCPAIDSLSLCLAPDLEAERLTGRKRGQPRTDDAGKLTRFTRLAGMFMGRVDVLDVGGWRFRFNLELR